MRAEQLWRNVLERLRTRLPKSTYDTWLAGTTAEMSEEGLSVHVESVHAFEWLEHRLRPIIQEVVNTEADREVAIRFVIQSTPPPSEQEAVDLPPPPPPPPSLQKGPDFELLTAGDIVTTEWPEPVWAVPNVLPVGVTILAGHPKIGKSWLTLQIARAVAMGERTLNEQANPGGVLYLALEDSPVRLQKRIFKQGWPADLNGLPLYFMLYGPFAEQIGDLSSYEGAIILAEYIKHCRPRLVVIDTLSMAFGGDQNVVNIMTEALAPIRDMAHSFNCAVLVVDHHNKKTSSPDVVLNILGSIAKGAVVDTSIGLYRQRNETHARLLITGRDVEDRLLAVWFDASVGEWQIEGDANALEIKIREQEILEALQDLGQTRVSEISQAVGQERGNTHRRLKKLVGSGLVERTEGEGENVWYRLSEEGKKQL